MHLYRIRVERLYRKSLQAIISFNKVIGVAMYISFAYHSYLSQQSLRVYVRVYVRVFLFYFFYILLGKACV
jgi:hypothetical protein